MIMNNEMILNNREEKQNKVYNMVTTAAKSIISDIALYYSKVLERKLDNKQTLHLLNAQLAFVMTVFPTECSFILRILCACWLLTALQRCKEVL